MAQVQIGLSSALLSFSSSPTLLNITTHRNRLFHQLFCYSCLSLLFAFYAPCRSVSVSAHVISSSLFLDLSRTMFLNVWFISNVLKPIKTVHSSSLSIYHMPNHQLTFYFDTPEVLCLHYYSDDVNESSCRCLVECQLTLPGSVT